MATKTISPKAGRKPADNVPLTDLKPWKTYGISRVDQDHKHNHGYNVRVGKLAPQWFSDKKCGGRKKALTQALSQRDLLFAKLPDRLKVRASRKTRNSKEKLV